MTNILLVEDDAAFVHLIENFLKKKGYSVSSKPNIKEAAAELLKADYKLILLDYNLPDGTAFDLIGHLQATGSKIPVIIMTGFHDVRTAVKAIHLGVADYITKPVNPEELMMLINQTLRPRESQGQRTAVKSEGFVKGRSDIAKELQRHVELIAPTNMSVIIQGESGTGKENIARSIHQNSTRSKGPFVAIDCGALSDELASSELFGHVKGAFTGAVADKKGEFEMANGGTLFLDEVGNLSYAVQVKLLRAVQEREIQPVGGNKLTKVDVRIITATNDDLKNSVKNGSFREDLYHRLNEFSIQVPPLRQRQEDLELFIHYFIDQANTELGRQVKIVSDNVMAIFKSYDWPGNLRELKNIIKRAVLLASGEQITLSDIPADMRAGDSPASATLPVKKEITDLKSMNEINEKELIIKTLQEVKYNKTKAAAILNIDRKTLYLKIVRYGIDG